MTPMTKSGSAFCPLSRGWPVRTRAPPSVSESSTSALALESMSPLSRVWRSSKVHWPLVGKRTPSGWTGSRPEWGPCRVGRPRPRRLRRGRCCPRSRVGSEQQSRTSLPPRWQDNQQSRASSQLTQGRVERPIQKGAPKLAIRSVDGLTYRSLGRARCSCLAQSCLCHSIRANIAVVLMPKEFGKPPSGAVHPALDRANRNTADHRHLLVAQTFGSDQQHRLTLLVRKPRQSTAQFGKLHAPRLVREDGELSR